MLHFDINKTLIATDKAGGKSLEDVLNHLLASEYRYRWEEGVSEPISYEEYIREIVLPGPEHDLELKAKRKVYLDHFLDYLKEQSHPLYLDVLKTYTAAFEKLQHSNGNVFPSFYKLLRVLDEAEISYTLYLRSFGSEIFEIAEEINSIYGELFAQSGSFKHRDLIVDGKNIGSDPSDIYRFLCNNSHMAIQDDWSYWMLGKKASSYGKPFIIDQNDPTILAIFFDDNIYDNIVAPIDMESGEPLPIEEVINRKQMVCVDTLKAILDDNYFFDLVNQARKNNN